jgi:hypothetical protein
MVIAEASAPGIIECTRMQNSNTTLECSRKVVLVLATLLEPISGGHLSRQHLSRYLYLCLLFELRSRPK